MPGFTLRKEEGEFPEGIWTPYGPELTEAQEQAGAVREAYKIRPLSLSKIDHFRTMASKKKWRQGQQVEEVDEKRRLELLWDYLIDGWEGVYLDEAKTQPAPCTLENKLLLSLNSLDRNNFIVTQGSLYANDDEAREEAEKVRFRGADQTSARSSEAQLRHVSETV